MSIKPIYAQQIEQCSKKIEFRKIVPKLVVEYVYLYTTAPIKRITCFFQVSSILKYRLSDIRKCNNFNDLENYFNNRQYIYGITFDKVYKFINPINPYIVIPNFKPPQNFYYLNNKVLDIITSNTNYV